jgi:hypothetical protein
MSLFLSYPSIAACLYSLTPHDTGLTTVSPINHHSTQYSHCLLLQYRYKKAGGTYNFDFTHAATEKGLTLEEAQAKAQEEENRRLEAEYDIKLELVACVNTLVQLDTPRDRKFTYRFLDLGIMRVLSQAITGYNYFNLNVMACHCASLLLERLDYSSVMLRPGQTTRTCYGAIHGGGSCTVADFVVPIAFEGVALMLTALPTMVGDIQVMMLLLHRCTYPVILLFFLSFLVVRSLSLLSIYCSLLVFSDTT